MLSVKEKFEKLRDCLTLGDIKQFNQLMENDKFVTDLPKRSPELFFLMYQSAVHPNSDSANLEKAHKLLDAAASAKYAPAVAEKGRILFVNALQTADYFEAEDCFRAAISESFMAKYYIALIYHKGLIERNGEKKFDDLEAKNQLKALVSARADYYQESVLLLAEVILKLKTLSKEDDSFFAEHIAPLAEKGNMDACRSLGKFNIIRLTDVVDRMSIQNDKDLGADFFTRKASIIKTRAHLEKIDQLMIKC